MLIRRIALVVRQTPFAMSQSVKQSLPTPEIRGSNIIIGKFI